MRPRGAWHAYLELHIEQGGTLDLARVPIGIVEGIVAIHRYDVVVEGMANHAGTTPMDGRQDALVAASQLVLAVREIAAGAPGPAGRAPSAGSTWSRTRPTSFPAGSTLERRVPRPVAVATLEALATAVRDAAAAIAAQTGTTDHDDAGQPQPAGAGPRRRAGGHRRAPPTGSAWRRGGCRAAPGTTRR